MIRYARNQRTGLSRFLADSRLPNNISELNLRRQAVGRKNWLFLGSDDGGTVNAVFTSLLASCRLLDVEPWSYLRDIFCLVPSWLDSGPDPDADGRRPADDGWLTVGGDHIVTAASVLQVRASPLEGCNACSRSPPNAAEVARGIDRPDGVGR